MVVASTRRIESTEKDKLPGKSRRMSAAWMTAVIVILMVGVGYAAWHFGVVEDTELITGEVTNTKTPMPASTDDSVEQVPVIEEPQDTPANSIVDVEPTYPAAIPEKQSDPGFNPETAVASVAEPNIDSESGQAAFDEPRTDPYVDRTEAIRSPPPTPVTPAIGTGVTLVSVGEILLADTAADYVRATLERHGIEVFDGLTIRESQILSLHKGR